MLHFFLLFVTLYDVDYNEAIPLFQFELAAIYFGFVVVLLLIYFD